MYASCDRHWNEGRRRLEPYTRMLYRVALLMFGTGLLAAGCGPKANGPSDADTEGGSSGASLDTDANPGVSTTGTEDETSGGSTGDEPSEPGDPGSLACEPFRSDVIVGEPTVEFEIRNESEEVVFFEPAGCGGEARIQVSNAERTTPAYPGCSISCDDLLRFAQGEFCDGSCNDCDPPTVGRIEPGGVYRSSWQPKWWTRVSMDAECSSACAGESCSVVDDFEDGAYTIAVELMRSCEGDACTCEGQSADGVCLGYDWSTNLNDPFEVEASWARPADDLVVLTVQ